uniref:Lysosome-associated membrane glycoprotein 5 n=1 Tax=Phallusia mammillata TaxID=59560 RepID=A0A6F9DKE2_9ASCI|nr:lysosome-associated membrane glycoprotein 1 [Phallusia mammillata]
MKIAIILGILAVSGLVKATGDTTEQPTDAPTNDTTTSPETITPTPSDTTTSTPPKTTGTPPHTTSKPTTPATTPAPVLATNTYTIKKNGNETCLLVTMSASFSVNGKSVIVGKDAKADTTKSNCGKLFVNFGTANWFSLLFKTDNKSFFLDTVEANVNTVDANTTKQEIGKAALKASYRCTSGIDIKLNHNVTMHTTNVQFQPFQVVKGQYGTAETCAADMTKNVIIPIVVGCALGGLIIIIIIAYLIGRRRIKHRYESM